MISYSSRRKIVTLDLRTGGTTQFAYKEQAGLRGFALKSMSLGGAIFADRTDGGAVQYWNSESNTLSQILRLKKGNSHFVQSAAMSPAGKYIAASIPNGPIHLVTNTGEKTAQLGFAGHPSSMVLSTEGNYLAVSDGNATTVFDCQNETELIQIDGWPVAFTADNSKLLFKKMGRSGQLKILSLDSGEIASSIPDGFGQFSYAVSTGNSIVACNSQFRKGNLDMSRITIANFKTGHLLTRIESDKVERFALSGDGKVLFTISRSNSGNLLKVWDVSKNVGQASGTIEKEEAKWPQGTRTFELSDSLRITIDATGELAPKDVENGLREVLKRVRNGK